MTAFMPCKTVFAARPDHPRINGQVECMNCTLKEATVKRYYYDNHQQSREHLYNFLNACNFARRLKTLQKLTPYQYINQSWRNKPERFIINTSHHKMGLNTLASC